MTKLEKRDALLNENHFRTALVSTPKIDDTKMTFTLISENNSGMRYDYSDGSSYEELLDITGADVSRLLTFFKDHDSSVDSAIGRVSNVRVDGSELVGDVEFASDEASQNIRTKYNEGILTDVSVRYSIDSYDIQEREGQVDLVTVRKFTLYELSAVGIGFDPGAKKRELKGDEPMEKKTVDNKVENADMVRELAELKDAQARAKTDLDDARAESAELKRQADIKDIGEKGNMDAEFVRGFLDNKEATTEDMLRKWLIERPENDVVRVGDIPDKAEMLRQLGDAVTAKLGGEVKLDANQFRGASLLDISRKLTGYEGYDKIELARRTMVTTDFPVLLIESGNRVLEQEWDRQPSTYKQWVTETDLPDFKKVKDVTRAGAGGRLDKITEGGELKEKYLVEGAEEWNLESFGNKFVLTREMIINDDLNAFNNMLGELVEMAAVTANGRAYDLLRGARDYAGYVMADGVPIFDAAHGGNTLNVDLDSAGLRAARLVMRKQLGLNGSTPLNITPTYLIVAPELEQVALELLNSTASLEDNKNSGVVNTEYRSVIPIVDAELATATEWYLMSARRTIKAGYLAGTGRRPILQTDSQSLSRTAFEGIFDFGVMAEAYQGMVKGK